MPCVCYTLAQRRAKPCAFCLWRIQKPSISGEARQSPKQKRFQKAFSFGGGHITAGLMEKLGVSFDLAELLKRKINLGYDVNSDGVYILLLNDEEYRIPLQKANVAVRFSLDELSEKLEAALRECPIELTSNVNVSLTGGGLSYMRGGKEYLSNRLELGVGVVAPRVPYMNKPDESACLGLLNYALIKNENK